MEIDRRRGETVIVRLTADEVVRLREGETIGDRTLSGTKVEVSPLSSLEEDDSKQYEYAIDRLERALDAKSKGRIYPNQDIQIFIPFVSLCDLRVPGVIVQKDHFETPLSNNGDAKKLIRTLPRGGVIVRFGGSVREIDVMALSHR